YTAIGIPQEWVALVQKAGYVTVDSISDLVAAKLHQTICGLNKKHKLELKNPTIDEVATWIEGSKK
ncbi:MAG: DUF4332 domain-containing protein, partial [Bacteroidales bacterium]